MASASGIKRLGLLEGELELARHWGAPAPLGRSYGCSGRLHGQTRPRDVAARRWTSPTCRRLGSNTPRRWSRSAPRCGELAAKPLARPVARRIRDRDARERQPARRSRSNRAVCRWRAAAAFRTCRTRVVHAERAADRRARGGGPEQPRNRSIAVRHPQNGRGAPHQRLPEAGDRRPRRTRRRAIAVRSASGWGVDRGSTPNFGGAVWGSPRCAAALRSRCCDS